MSEKMRKMLLTQLCFGCISLSVVYQFSLSYLMCTVLFVFFRREGEKCQLEPCRHGGRCREGWNRYICDCTMTSYSGPNCEEGMFISCKDTNVTETYMYHIHWLHAMCIYTHELYTGRFRVHICTFIITLMPLPELYR